MSYALLLLSYLLGSVPTSYLIGKYFHGIDLRQHGSGNLGATNAFRVLGARSALPVVLVDIGKGFAPAGLFPRLADTGFGWTLAFGAAAILGHMFSVWVRFRGGKGMATGAGVFLALAPWAVLGGIVLWTTLTFATGYVSVGSIAAAAALPLLVALTPHAGGGAVVWFSLALGAFVVWAHRGNFRRLLRGEENRFRGGRREPETAAEPVEEGGDFRA
ncbi:MAG TPA: glycerol-3-phosphate 1-O-acyltransferase PlsY [Longimicrobiales bacterium]|nr:glycerol-3-phosphate 1-O-acyltransferase PlsY [Longimicrobiales bacterium]